MKRFLIITLLSISGFSFSQEMYTDTIVDNHHFNYIRIDTINNSTFYGNMIDSKLSGISLEFKEMEILDEYEQVKVEGVFKDGLKTGTWTITDTTGGIILKGKYKEDLRVGKWCLYGGCEIYWYDQEGNVQRKGKGKCLGC